MVMQMRGHIPNLSATPNNATLPHLIVGLSGGVDSVVLLHLLNNLKSQLGFTLSAMHIHHGLSAHADDWLIFCENYCAALGVEFDSERVRVDQDDGLGIEAAARAARYQALFNRKQALSAQAIVTAHHVQDQAETFMLQAFRGAGVKGLSAMAASDAAGHLRPLLAISKQEICAYAHEHNLQWVEDDSNTNDHYERNFLRSNVMPILRERYPHIDVTLSRSASLLAEAQSLLDIMAQEDLSTCDLQSEWLGESIALPHFHALGEVRAKNMLRGWFQQQQLLMPKRVQLNEYWQQLSAVRPHRYLHLPLSDVSHQHAAFLHHYQGRLYCVRKPPALPEQALIWQGGATQQWGGWSLDFKLVKGKGIALAMLGISPADITLHLRYGKAMTLDASKQLLIHVRSGGEQLQPHANRPRRELKVIFQMLGIPPWQRLFYPLVSLRHADEETLLGLLPATINHDWLPGRNAYGVVITFTPITQSILV